jgi:hypothetical protein
MRVDLGHICLHVVSRELSDTPARPGLFSVYTSYSSVAQTKKARRLGRAKSKGEEFSVVLFEP